MLGKRKTGQKLPKILCHLQMKKIDRRRKGTLNCFLGWWSVGSFRNGGRCRDKSWGCTWKIRKAWYYWKPFEADAPTLASIENVSRLDSEVEDLKTKSKQLGSTVNELKESIQFNEEDISDLKLENKKVTTRTSLPEDLLKERECKNCGATRKAG